MQPSWVSRAFSKPSEKAPSAGDRDSMATMESLYQNMRMDLPSALTFLRVPLGSSSASQILTKVPGTGGRDSAGAAAVSASASARTVREEARRLRMRSAADRATPVEIFAEGGRRAAATGARADAREAAEARTTGVEVMINADIAVGLRTLSPMRARRGRLWVAREGSSFPPGVPSFRSEFSQNDDVADS